MALRVRRASCRVLAKMAAACFRLESEVTRRVPGDCECYKLWFRDAATRRLFRFALSLLGGTINWVIILNFTVSHGL